MLRVAEEGKRTDTGRQRQANEDAYFARAPTYAVADGMGGAQAGEVASRIAVEAFEDGLGSGPAEAALGELVRSANRRINEMATVDATHAGMGTTLTAAHLTEDGVAVAHVGDSRLYVFRDGELKRLTKDHSLVEELRRQGQLTEAQAEVHPQKSIITRALGPEPSVQVDTFTFTARDGDLFLICSDGLTTMISEAEIADHLARGAPLQKTVDGLVRAANAAGGRDNITTIAFKVEEVHARTDDDQGTLAGQEAEQAGLTAAAVREAAEQADRDRAPVETPSAQDGPDATLVRRPSGRRERTAGGVRRRLGARRTVAAVAGLAIAALIVGGALLGMRQVYFLGTDEAGRVAVYRGLPYELPAGVDLYSKEYASPVQSADLAPARRRAVTAHELRSRTNAVDLVRDIEDEAGLRRSDR